MSVVQKVTLDATPHSSTHEINHIQLKWLFEITLRDLLTNVCSNSSYQQLLQTYQSHLGAIQPAERQLRLQQLEID